ncbi:MAG: helix-turn-helix domain-containing protein [Labilibaculum antarcticum]
MNNSSIPKYVFNNRKSKLGLEIVPLERILSYSKENNHKAHRTNFYQILFVTKGRGVHEVDFETIGYSENTIIPVAMGQVQRFSDNEQLRGFALLFTTDFLIKEELDYSYLYDFTIFLHSIKPVGLFANKSIYTIWEDIISEQKKGQAFQTGEYQRNLLKNFLIQLERSKRDRIDIVCNDSFNLYLKFRRILEEKINYKLRVTDVCEQLNVTSKQINLAVKLFANTTAKQYMEDRVILEIKRLLIYSPLSVKEIAYEIGFEDPTNFTKYFKARVKMLPSEYQKKN